MGCIYMPKKWIHFRHKVVIQLAKIIMGPYLRLKYGYHYQKYKGHNRPCLILYNHQTVMDQFFVGLICNHKTYYVMSDDLASIPFVSRVLSFLVHPIPYKKSSTDFSILKNCKKVANEGGSIAIAAEGNRTFSGKTEYIKPSTAKMVQFLKLPLVFIHIEGGFGVHPRFADKPRKGKCQGYVYQVYEYEDYKEMSVDELNQLIQHNLYVDESRRNQRYKSKHSAEYLERVIYRCPTCGITHFLSHRDRLICTTCHTHWIYNEYNHFEGVEEVSPFETLNDWYEYQKTSLYQMQLLQYNVNQVLSEDRVSLYAYIPRKKKQLLMKNVKIEIYPNRWKLIDTSCTEYVFFFDDIVSAGVFGRNKISFFTKDDAYQMKSDVHFNAIKYIQLLYKYKIEKGENIDDKFLGL